jgi:hypothetical protein
MKTKKLLSLALVFVLTLTLVPTSVVSANETYTPYAASDVYDGLTITFSSVIGRVALVNDSGTTQIRYYVNGRDGVSFSSAVDVQLSGSSNYSQRLNAVTSISNIHPAVENANIIGGLKDANGENVFVVIFFSATSSQIDKDREWIGTTLNDSPRALERVGQTRPVRVMYDGSVIDWKALYKKHMAAQNPPGHFALLDINDDGIPEVFYAPSILTNAEATMLYILKHDKSVRASGRVVGVAHDLNQVRIHQYLDGTIYLYVTYGGYGSASSPMYLTKDGVLQSFDYHGGQPSSSNPLLSEQIKWTAYTQQAFNNAIDGWKSSDISVTQPMTLNASVYAPGSQMTITLSNVTQKMIDDGAYVQIRKPETNAEISTLISSTPMYNAVQMVVTPTMVYTVTVRTSGVNAIEEGNYEVRFYVGNNSIATQPNVGLIATVPITISRSATPPATNPLDSASSWARDGITSALSKGFVPSDLQSSYTNVITRAEFCRMAVKWLEYRLGKDINTIVAENGDPAKMNHTFSDTTDPNILAAYRLGVTGGTSAPTATTPGIFNPSGQFSREQAATMIMNTCKAAGMDVSKTASAGFTDIGTASSWAVDGINYVRNAGIMQGTSTTPLVFSPKNNYTREQSILTFNNIQ